MTSSNFGSLRNVDHLVIFNVVLKTLLKLPVSLRYKFVVLFQCQCKTILVNQHKKLGSPMKR